MESGNSKNLNEKELHPQRVTVRCSIMCVRIICTYFFENAESYTETVNGEGYRLTLIMTDPVLSSQSNNEHNPHAYSNNYT